MHRKTICWKECQGYNLETHKKDADNVLYHRKTGEVRHISSALLKILKIKEKKSKKYLNPYLKKLLSYWWFEFYVLSSTRVVSFRYMNTFKQLKKIINLPSDCDFFGLHVHSERIPLLQLKALQNEKSGNPIKNFTITTTFSALKQQNNV